jgi:predicted nucleic acid-binding protein
MSRFLPDTSCMVALVCPWHEHHELVFEELDGRLQGGQQMVVAAHAAVETYAVLTRLPSPHRLSPVAARDLVLENFMSSAQVVALDAMHYRELLARAPVSGIRSGRVYDSIIAACAVLAEVSCLVTLNERDFRSFATDRLAVVVPGRGGAANPA